MDKYMWQALVLSVVFYTKSGLTSGYHPRYYNCHPCHCFEQKANELIAKCSGKSLDRIPTTIPNFVSSLTLSHNLFSQVEPGSLKRFSNLHFLDLAFNNITFLHRDSLVGAKMLKTLSFRENKIKLASSAYPEGLFRFQQKLSTLDISKNDHGAAGSHYPDRTFADLVSIQTLMVDGLSRASFGEGFSNLTKLTNLHLSGKRGYCQIGYLSNTSFSNLPFLKFLDMRKCELQKIEKSTFLPLRHISTLDVSDNQHMGFDVLGEAFYGLRHSALRVLNMSKVVPTFAIGVEFKEDHVKYLNDTRLKHLYADTNRLELISSKVPKYLASVELLSVKGNRFTFGMYMFSLDQLLNLKEFYVSNQYASYDEFFSFPHTNTYELAYMHVHRRGVSSMLDNVTSGYNNPPRGEHLQRWQHQRLGYTNFKYMIDFHLKIPMPPNLIYINVSSSNLAYNIIEFNVHENKIKIADFSNNLLKRWYGPINLDYLEFLDLSQNSCDFMSKNFLKSFPNLRHLNVSHNYLAASLMNYTGGELFQHATNLRTLRIASNMVAELPSSLLINQHELENLDLSWNLMTTWTLQVSHMKNLTALDISNNRFEGIPVSLRRQIDDISETRHGVVHLRLSGNVFKCNCRYLDGFQWLKNHVMVDDVNASSCVMDDGKYMSLNNLEDIVLTLQEDCHTIQPIIGGTVTGILAFFVVVVAGVIYRYRWRLRYMYYSTRRKYRGYQRLTEENNFTYDAFVSYADEDRNFVVQDMRNALEKTYGLRLCIHHRDFMVGEAITANILNAIQSSRRTIVILSPSFLRSSWCDYEVHMARLESIYTGRDVLCVVWYIDVPQNVALTGDISFEIEHGTYLRYPTNCEDKESFWQNLKDAIAC